MAAEKSESWDIELLRSDDGGYGGVAQGHNYDGGAVMWWSSTWMEMQQWMGARQLRVEVAALETGLHDDAAAMDRARALERQRRHGVGLAGSGGEFAAAWRHGSCSSTAWTVSTVVAWEIQSRERAWARSGGVVLGILGRD
ncbi:hypothetical protein M0R45_035717 [Rubus argutus]|uniref:MHC class I antigen n=1 Tax=Rubus argutus TaxID=59490 RepID=A0AAW1VZ97_RUBAR